jgi:hypothetical protein
MRKAIILAIALAGLPAAGDLPAREWGIARPVVLPAMAAPGLVYLPVDKDALAGVRSLSEYRVVRGGREEVAYRMVLEEGGTETRTLAAKVVSKATLKKAQAQITLDLGREGPLASRVDLILRGDNFRSRAGVEGSLDQSQWWLLAGQGIVYRHESRFQQTWVAVPAGRHRFLRITLQRSQGELPEIEGARVVSVTEIPRRLVAVAATFSRREDSRKHLTVLGLDLGRLSRDLAEARFEVQEPTFDRPVEIESASGGPAKSGGYELYWNGTLQRLAAGKAVVLPLGISAARRLRISILNGDDRPLTIRRVTVWRVRRGLVFSADPMRKYELWYGRPNAPQPVYEIQRLPMTTALAKLPLARLGPGQKLPVRPPPPPPWSEQHRGLFWIVLAAVLALLAIVILRAMRGVRNLPPHE